MAVSGRRAYGAFTAESTVQAGKCWCNPCLTMSQEVKASGFCDDCQEYLCDICLDCHKKTKASKHHSLQERINSLSVSDDSSDEIKHYNSLKYIGSITIKTKTDEKPCCLKGLTYLSDNKIMVADGSNGTVKIIDINNQRETEKVYFNKVTRFSSDELSDGGVAIAYTCGTDNTNLNWCVGTLRTNYKYLSHCHCITFRDGYYYGLLVRHQYEPEKPGNGYYRPIITSSSYSIEVCDVCELYNNRPNVIPINSLFGNIYNSLLSAYMTLSKDKRNVYITNGSEVSSITLQDGKATDKYCHSNLSQAQDMTVVGDGSLLICCNKAFGTIHHVSADLKPLHVWSGGFRLGIPWASSFCYNSKNHCLYVASCDEIKMFKLE